MFMLVSMLSLLQTANEASYAIGAFNVYNLEGIQAVIAASEACRSPAILQISSSALKRMKTHLVMFCLAATQRFTRLIWMH